MKLKKGLLTLFCCVLFAAPAAAERILFIPLDDRPVCFSYPVAAFLAAGVEVVTPPADLLASRWHKGDPEQLLAWLEAQAPHAAGAVVSADSVLYGGLVPSRTHHETPARLTARLERLNRLAEGPLPLRLYVFSTVMRTPRMSAGNVEPPYYEAWGPTLFQVGALLDKEERGLLTAAEAGEKSSLQQLLPPDVWQDWRQRRQLNEQMNERLIQSVAAGRYAYFVLGRDDTAVYSQSRREFRRLSRLTPALPSTQYRSFAGADEAGWVLLLRAKNDLTQQLPFVKVVYAPGAGPDTVAAYEDGRIGCSVTSHLQAAGVLPVQAKPDLLLAVNTPASGKTAEAASFDNRLPQAVDPEWLSLLQDAVTSAAPVALADVAFANGGDDALVRRLADEGLALRLAAYGGWNTAGNTIGSALVQGVLAGEQTKPAQQKQLAVRYIEDWGYQARVRQALSEQVVWAQGWNGSNLTRGQRTQLEQAAAVRLRALAAKYRLLPAGVAPEQVQVALPWDRMFEAYVTIEE